MAARKGELTSAALDRDWPHQVALPAKECTGESEKRHRDFCAALTLAPRQHTVRKDGTDFLVYCFANQAHADQFRERFGGYKFNPTDRGRGNAWHRWRKA